MFRVRNSWTRHVPHGAVAEVHYYPPYSSASGVCTSTLPGFGMRRQNYPVLYLLHGAGDCDDHGRPLVAQALSWTT